MNLDRIGKYRVVGRIGEGAMGEVYKAHDPLLNRYVAVKTISPALAANAEFRSRFQREAQSAAQLNHPNVVTIFDFGAEPDTGLTYMAMEFLEGRDLRSAIRDRTLGHLGQKLSVIEQLCDGLAFAHSRGVVHRDLKPGNIHVLPNGQVKVLDFGLARLGASDLTRTGTVLGTPNYMSPEQVRGQKADVRSDVFSLGSVFYEILTGQRAFDAASMAEVLQSICDREPEPIRRRAPDTPADLVAIVERALRKKREERYADAGEMARALAAARETIAGETLALPAGEDAEATVLEPRSVVRPAARSRVSVAGATALTLRREASQPGTLRTPGTQPGPPPTHVPEVEPSAASPVRTIAIGVGSLAVVALVAGGLWLRSRASAVAPPSAAVAQEQVDILTEQLAMSKVELARADLDNRAYAEAADHAREVLKIDAKNAEGLAILQRAEGAQRELKQAVADARAALSGGDTAAAAAALGRVLALDPRHPAAAELSSQLDRYFRGQAEEAKRAAGEARTAAEAAKAGAHAAFAPARALADAADALFGREKYATAAQKYLEARNGFEAARREAEAARAAQAAEGARAAAAAEAQRRAAASPSPALVRGPVLPSPSVAPQPLPPSAAPTAAPTAAPAAAVAVAAPSAATNARVADGPEGQVRRVISDYVRAIETRDVPLFRSLMPDIGADGEKKLRDAFAAVKTQTVGITIESIQMEGEQATVQVLRQDTINGRQQKAVHQTFRIAQAGGAWRIASMKAQ